jgi:glycosyltransferase involved in cell wall biosynthesis
MRILQVATKDNSGGAARAAFRLHQGLLNAGVDASMLVAYKSSNDPRVKVVPRNQTPLGIARRQWDRFQTNRIIGRHAAAIARGHELFTTDRAANKNDLPNSLPDCDVLHLNWINGLLDYETFFARLPRHLPLIWSMHDMNTMTGGCHYDAGCGRYTRGCGKCPALESDSEHDLSERVFQRKLKSLASLPDHRLHLVGASQWIVDCARASPMLSRFSSSVIPYGLDTSLFRPIEQLACRKVLGIPLDAKVVLFAADAVENVRKGFALLLKAVQTLKEIPGIFLLSLGVSHGDPITGIPHLSLGLVTTDQLLPAVYGAADVLVIPSLQEVFGQTVTEAFACGTPVVGYDTGGIPELVKPGTTGYLAKVGDVGELAAAIRRSLDEVKGQGMSRACREIAVAEYDSKVQAARFIELYRQAMERMRSTGKS